MKQTILLSLASFAAVACTNQSGKLTIKGTVADATLNGKYLYIVNDSQKDWKDSCLVEDSKFQYEISPKDAVRLYIHDNISQEVAIIAEDGVVNVKFGEMSEVSGTPLNDAFSAYQNKMMTLGKDFEAEYQSLKASQADDSTIEARYNIAINKAKTMLDETLKANSDNNLGLIMLIEIANDMTLDQIKAASAKFGEKANNFIPLQQIITSKENLENTQEGAIFTDFDSVNPDGSPAKLSDYVGKGNYVLADFWASWCGPCREEIPNIKEIYQQYKDKGLVVLGINVWDKKEAFEKAVQELEIPWAQICSFDNNNPTTAYGIKGIPHIILFAPDGTIVERNLRGDGMKAKIAEVYKTK